MTPLEKTMLFLKHLRQNKATRVFIRQTFNGFVTLLIAYLGEIQGDYVMFLPVVYALINSITKYINKKYFHDIGVLSE